MNLYRFTVSSLVYIVFVVLLVTAAAMFAHQLSNAITLAALVISGIPACIAWQSCGFVKDEPPIRIRAAEVGVIVVFALAALRSFCWLIYRAGNELKILCRYNIGDLPLHRDYILFMAQDRHFWPLNPILAHSGGIHYPVGVDLLNTLAVMLGAPLTTSLIWAGLIGSLFTAVALFRWGRAFVIAGLLFNGGLAFTLFWNGAMPPEIIEWKNLFLSLFVTQREFLFALPAGLLLIDSWRRRWNANRERRPLPLWIEWTLYAAMPIFHPHTFLFLSALLGWWIFVAPRAIRTHVWKLGLLALPLASWLAWLVSDHFAKSSPSFIGWHIGWMEGAHPVQFWIANFGIFPLLIVALLLYLAPRRDRLEGAAQLRAFVVPSCLILLACCFVRFAPWEWDNTKLMLWAYLALLPFLWKYLFAPLVMPLRVLLLALFFAGGASSLLAELNPPDNGYVIARCSTLDGLQSALTAANIQPSATFAAAPTYNHPLLLLGRKVAVGYLGHFAGHGLPYQKQYAQLNDLMNGAPDWKQAAKRLGARYLFWGADEVAEWPDSKKPWESACKLIGSGAWGSLYELD